MRKLVLMFLLLPSVAMATHKMPERAYQQMYCPKQFREIKLFDNSRVDCLTDTFAIEFDFAPKWAEALGQSLYYSYVTGRQATIFLILERDSDFRYVKRLKPLCEKYGVLLTLIY